MQGYIYGIPMRITIYFWDILRILKTAATEPFSLQKTVNGTLSILRSTEVPALTAGEFHNVVFQAKGRAYRVVIDGKIMCNLLKPKRTKLFAAQLS